MAQRRLALKKMLLTLFGLGTAGIAVKGAEAIPDEQVTGSIEYDQDVPLFSGHMIHNGLVYIAGKGAHTEPFEIKAHTEIVLKELEKELVKAGTSMDKVLKVTVYLDDIKDYKAMNEVYRGRFGKNPPVRTTIAVAKGGVPGNSLVEMDCIARL
jgi:enamine deaminase RidA (YjgF/YER057c/UK114 family)